MPFGQRRKLFRIRRNARLARVTLCADTFLSRHVNVDIDDSLQSMPPSFTADRCHYTPGSSIPNVVTSHRKAKHEKKSIDAILTRSPQSFWPVFFGNGHSRKYRHLHLSSRAVSRQRTSELEEKKLGRDRHSCRLWPFLLLHNRNLIRKKFCCCKHRKPLDQVHELWPKTASLYASNAKKTLSSVQKFRSNKLTRVKLAMDLVKVHPLTATPTEAWEQVGTLYMYIPAACTHN
jgi:hypothetical protein